jgi:hypothetical protein
MLRVFFGDMKDAVYNTAVFFKLEQENITWIEIN